jgi:hypothetical protein
MQTTSIIAGRDVAGPVPIPSHDPAGGGLDHPGPHRDLLVVAGGATVAARQVGEHQVDALGFPLGVGRAERAGQLGARRLEPDRVDSVVDDPHLVGLGVAGAQPDGVGAGLHRRGL